MKSLILFYFIILSVQMGFSQSETRLEQALKSCDANQLQQILQQSDKEWQESLTVPLPMLVAFHCDKKMLQVLESFDINFNKKGILYIDEKKEKYCGSILAIAASKGDLEMLQYLIDEIKIPVDDQELYLETGKEEGRTALGVALTKERAEIMSYLIEKKADLTLALADPGKTIQETLSEAISQSYPNINVLKQSLDLITDFGDNNTPPLIEAVLNKDLETVKKFIEQGVDPNNTYNIGWTALHLAAEVNSPEICEFLLEKGASISNLNKYGFTPLGIAQGNGYTQIADLILNYASTKTAPAIEDIQVVLQQNLSKVHHLQVSKNGTWILVNDHLFNFHTGRKITEFEGVIAKFTPDEAFLIQLTGQEGIPTIWNWQEEIPFGYFTAEGGTVENQTKNPYYSNQQIYCDAQINFLITAYDSIYQGWNIKTGQKADLPAISKAKFISSNPYGTKLLTIDHKENVKVFNEFDAATPILEFAASRMGYKIHSVHVDEHGEKAALSYKHLDRSADFLVELFNLEKGHSEISFKIKQELTAISLNPKADLVVYSAQDTQVYLKNLKTQELFSLPKAHQKTINCLQFSSDGQYIISGSSDGSAVAYSVIDKKIYQSYRGFLSQDIGSKIGAVKFSLDGQWILNGNIAKIFDLVQMKVFNLYSTVAAITPNKDWIIRKGTKKETAISKVIDANDYLQKYPTSLSAKSLVRFSPEQILEGHQEKISDLVVSSDNKHLLSTSKDGEVIVWSLDNGLQLSKFQTRCEIQELRFNPSNTDAVVKYWNGDTELYSITSGQLKLKAEEIAYSLKSTWQAVLNDSILKVHNLKNGEELTIQTNLKYTLRVAFSNNERYLTYFDTNYHIACYDLQSKKISHHFEDITFYTDACFSPDDKYFLIKSGKMIEVYSMQTKEKHFIVEENAPTSAVISISPDARFLTTVGDKEYSIILWELATGNPAFKIFFPGSSLGKGQFVITTPDGYYMSSKGAVSALNFKQQLKVFPFEQFDLRFNRPDIIMERLGYAPKALVAVYKQAWQKRMSKLGFSEEQFSTDFHLPKIELLTTDIPTISKDKKLTIHLAAIDSKIPLKRINVWVNDVPVYGIKGIDLTEKETLHQVEKAINISLSEGLNKIQLSCYNTQGIESLKETFEIQYEPVVPIKPDLYLIGIGAARYQNEAMNLSYPVKDIKDFFSIFDLKQESYGQINTIQLFDNQVTIENIRNLKQSLLNTNVDDKVILFYAGHGVFDDNFDYFLSTYAMDFNVPKQQGIPYDLLEGILDGISARNKVILVDACYAGEIDKAYIDKIEQHNRKKKDVQFRAVGNEAPSYNKLGIQNIFELMKTLFVDLRRNSGTTIIASASGVQPAAESSKWENSAFTFVLLQALKEEEADGVLGGLKNGEITVAELQHYLNYKVGELTDFLQQPTTRLENISNDFQIW